MGNTPKKWKEIKGGWIVGLPMILFFASILFEKPYINFETSFILSMSWQILMVSFGAFTILMYLIKVGSASKTSNLFF